MKLSHLLGCAVVGLSGVSSALAQTDPTLLCLGNLPANEKLGALRVKLSLGSTKATTFQMLADESLATDEERDAIGVWATLRADCVALGEDFRASKFPPALRPLPSEGERRVMAEAVELYQRKINFGEFNKRRQAIAAELSQRWESGARQARESNERTQQAQQAQAAQERARQQSDMASMLQQFKPTPFVPLAPITPRPTVTTTCAAYGGQLNCTTQ